MEGSSTSRVWLSGETTFQAEGTARAKALWQERPRGAGGGPVWREGADGEAEPWSQAEVSGGERAHSQSCWALMVKVKALAFTLGEVGARGRATRSDTSSRPFSGCHGANPLGEGARKAGRRLQQGSK